MNCPGRTGTSKPRPVGPGAPPTLGPFLSVTGEMDMGEIPGVDPLRCIDLVWTLRDIKAKRSQLFPIDPDHLRELIGLGLVELRDDVPVVTNAGHQVLV